MTPYGEDLGVTVLIMDFIGNLPITPVNRSYGMDYTKSPSPTQGRFSRVFHGTNSFHFASFIKLPWLTIILFKLEMLLSIKQEVAAGFHHAATFIILIS